MNERKERLAGGFSQWLRTICFALADGTDMNVPCGQCTACCQSSYFIHIRPEEKETLASIPNALQFPAPGFPKGHVVLGYNEKGSCPMLVGGGCSIYEVRPLTCRQFDCRIFTACGIHASLDENSQINRQTERWRFSIPTNQDKMELDAVQSAARFLTDRNQHFPEGFLPANSTQLAFLSIMVYEVFLNNSDAFSTPKRTARAVIHTYEKFKGSKRE